MAKKVTAEQLEELRISFSHFDKNGDGEITLDELEQTLRAMGWKPDAEELREVMKKADLNRNGSISFDEYVEIASKHLDVSHDDLRNAFEVFDENGDGKITVDELKKVLERFGEELTMKQVEEMICVADKDGDNTLDFEEFVAFMQSFQ